MSDIPRLRMFAGPNGSGKSTLKSVISPTLLGVYINPDDIEKDIRENDFLDLTAYGVNTKAEEILNFFAHAPLLKAVSMEDEANELSFFDNKLSFHNVIVNAYFASVAASFIRQKLLETLTVSPLK